MNAFLPNWVGARCIFYASVCKPPDDHLWIISQLHFN